MIRSLFVSASAMMLISASPLEGDLSKRFDVVQQLEDRSPGERGYAEALKAKAPSQHDLAVFSSDFAATVPIVVSEFPSTWTSSASPTYTFGTMAVTVMQQSGSQGNGHSNHGNGNGNGHTEHGNGNGFGHGGWHNPGNPHTGAIPEPATWLMLIVGFGVVGAALRQRPERPKLIYV